MVTSNQFIPISLAVTVLIAVRGQAQPNCNDPASLLTQQDLNFCANERAKSADAKLNQLYRQLRTKYKDNSAVEDSLITAQIAWIKFRDLNCAFARKRFEGGSIASIIYNNCIDRVTTERTKELENYLKEGKM